MTAFEAAQELLARLEAAFEQSGRRRFKLAYVSDGSVVFDFDETLAIEWDATVGNPGTEAAPGSPIDMSSGTLPTRVEFTIHCTRDGLWQHENIPPVPVKIQANAELVHSDATLIIDTILEGLRDSTLFGVCGDVFFLGQSAVVGEGGVVGSHTRISVALG